MKKILTAAVVIFIVIAIFTTIDFSDNSGNSGSSTSSGFVMKSGYIYINDFSVYYTSSGESPNGDINESAMSTNKSVSLQKCYLVIDFSFEMITNNSDNSEKLTLQVTANNADVLNCRVESADTSTTSSTTTDNVTVLTATFTLPEKANTEKSERVIISATPQVETGNVELYYDFLCDTKTPYTFSQYDGYATVTDDTITLKNCTLLNYSMSSTEYSVTGTGDIELTECTIRSERNGLPVTQIGSGAFKNCTTVTTITIPDSVTYIGNSAFSGCTALESVTFGGGLTSVGSYAFQNCSVLSEIIIPDSVTEIGSSAFSGCTALENVTLGSGITSIDSCAFQDCAAISEITISDSVTYIGDSAFSGCTALEYVFISDISCWCGISFGDSTANPLYYAENLYLNDGLVTEISVSAGVSSIGSYAFYGYDALTSVNLSNKITSIGEHAFSECVNLSNVYNCNTVKTIGEAAFYGCTSLEYISEMLNLTSIGNSAFCGCSSLLAIDIADNVTYIGDYTFSGCSSLTEVTIPDSVTTIGSYAFNENTSMKFLAIGKGVTTIKGYAFYNTTALTEIYYNAAAAATTNSMSGTFIFSYAGQSGDGITIYVGDDVTSIGAYMFCPFNDESNQDMKINCVIFSEGSKCTSLGRGLFEYNTYMKYVVLPPSITDIAEYAFNGCTALKSVYYLGVAGEYTINIKGYNTPFNSAIKYYYSAEEPDYTDGYNYWYYSNFGEIIIWTQPEEQTDTFD